MSMRRAWGLLQQSSASPGWRERRRHAGYRLLLPPQGSESMWKFTLRTWGLIVYFRNLAETSSLLLTSHVASRHLIFSKRPHDVLVSLHIAVARSRMVRQAYSLHSARDATSSMSHGVRSIQLSKDCARPKVSKRALVSGRRAQIILLKSFAITYDLDLGGHAVVRLGYFAAARRAPAAPIRMHHAAGALRSKLCSRLRGMRYVLPSAWRGSVQPVTRTLGGGGWKSTSLLLQSTRLSILHGLIL
mmetsp:Transcript_13745/g.41853  ORF Transcript_13745/g.41853 Transcript_13745/m.41853 type:complete len:245 (-) Transcript_13745:87-821(-)